MNLLQDLKFQYKIGAIYQKLIYWNVALFAVPGIIFAVLSWLSIKIDYTYFVSLSSNPLDLLWKPWSLISYSFFHAGLFHLFFNMLVLNFSGRLFMTYFTSKQFLGLYLLSGLFAGFVYIFIFYILKIEAPIMGASAAIMGVLMATTTYSPLMDLRLLLIGSVKLWHVTAFILFLDLVQLQLENTGGHLSHLAGAFFGFIFIKLLQAGTDLSNLTSSLLLFFTSFFRKSKKQPFKKIHTNYSTKPAEKRVSKIVIKDKIQQQIDEILDKISQSGYDSLSKEEKEFLFKAGK